MAIPCALSVQSGLAFIYIIWAVMIVVCFAYGAPPAACPAPAIWRGANLCSLRFCTGVLHRSLTAAAYGQGG